MGTLKQGAEQAIKNCMRIKSADKVLVVGDYQSKKIVEALVSAAKHITNSVKYFYLEDYAKRPLKKLPKDIAKAAQWSTATFYTASSQPGEKVSIRFPLIRLATTKKGSRQAHMSDVSEIIMRTGMCADYKIIKKFTKKIFNIVRKAKKIRVLTKKGTDITVILSPKLRWVVADGDIIKASQGWSNLPDGEVFTSPQDANGVLVIDGVLGDWLGPKYGFMDKQPLRLIIKNSRVVKAECKNKKLLADFKKYIKQDSNANRLGEFAIGTNIALKKLVGEMLQDEKYPGVHIAVGDSYPDHTNAKWGSKAHCDMVIKKTTIIVDGKMIMREGKFLIK